MVQGSAAVVLLLDLSCALASVHVVMHWFLASKDIAMTYAQVEGRSNGFHPSIGPHWPDIEL